MKLLMDTWENTYQVDDIIWNLRSIPREAFNPLTDLWDHLDCPVCDITFYRLGLDKHLITHRYRLPWWLRLLKKIVK